MTTNMLEHMTEVRPAEVDKSDIPIVALLLHGFGSSRDEVGGFYAKLADAFAEVGVGSVRIDFRGYGENDTNTTTATSTVNTMVEDALNAIQYVRRFYNRDSDDTKEVKIVIVGFSLGALVGARVVHEPNVTAYVGISPVNNPVSDFISSFDGNGADGANPNQSNPSVAAIFKQIKEGDANPFSNKETVISSKEETFDFDLGFRHVTLSTAFFGALAASPTTCDVLTGQIVSEHTLSARKQVLAQKFAGRILLIAGTNDWSHKNAQAISHAMSNSCCGGESQYHDNDLLRSPQSSQSHDCNEPQFISLSEADHILNCFDADNSRVAETITAITEFIGSL
eukprot:TRINITY_DN26394_c0_g1_i1.p1 TRINITY_DN26394_c0_g1~~TRINITY_DN26394_c0_g1_i1.p1  ORF type:complete len:339 (-),score=24.04 TRINITY_DN26394_c0_g1_i1:379-1395(-)